MPSQDSQPRKRSQRPKSAPDLDNLLEYASRTLSGRALSAGEMRARLRRRGGSPADIDRVMARLQEYGAVDDPKFAEMFATARRDNQGLGRARVLRDLRARSVPAAVAEKAVANAFAGEDEKARADAYLRRKFPRVRLPEHLAEPRNLAAAFRRLRYAGFSAASSIRVLQRYSGRAEELQDDDSPSMDG